MTPNPTEKKVDVRIGIQRTARELELELEDTMTKDAVKKEVEKVLNAGLVLWLKDKKGREIGVPAHALAYVELGADAAERRMGFIG